MNPQNSLFDESLNCGEDFSIVKQELIQKFQENNFEYFHNENDFDFLFDGEKNQKIRREQNVMDSFDRDFQSKGYTPNKYEVPEIMQTPLQDYIIEKDSPNNNSYLVDNNNSFSKLKQLNKRRIKKALEIENDEYNLMQLFWGNNIQNYVSPIKSNYKNNLFKFSDLNKQFQNDNTELNKSVVKSPFIMEKQYNNENILKSLTNSNGFKRFNDENHPFSFKLNQTPKRNNFEIKDQIFYPSQKENISNLKTFFIKQEQSAPTHLIYKNNAILPVTPNNTYFSEKKMNSFQFLGKAQKNLGFHRNDKSILETPSRRERGLRVLSLKVRDIVCEKNHTTYKQVAQSLINEMEDKIIFKEKGKDEQNIKRRVYDALNVLIAADVLKKKGKTVECDENINLVGKGFKTMKVDEKNNYVSKINEMNVKLENKKVILQELLLKSISLQQLIERNKTNNINSSLIENVKEKIEFPFVALEFPSFKPEELKIFMNSNKNNLSLFSKSEFKIHGDIDILMKMKFHSYEKCKLLNFLPKETHKYLPDEIKNEN